VGVVFPFVHPRGHHLGQVRAVAVVGAHVRKPWSVPPPTPGSSSTAAVPRWPPRVPCYAAPAARNSSDAVALAAACPDISYVVQQICLENIAMLQELFSVSPSPARIFHMLFSKFAFTYMILVLIICSFLSVFLAIFAGLQILGWLSRYTSNKLVSYSDIDWAGYPDTLHIRVVHLFGH
jgi:hypothetical protein